MGLPATSTEKATCWPAAVGGGAAGGGGAARGGFFLVAPFSINHPPRRHFVIPYTGEAMGWSAAYPLHKGAYEDSANSADIASKRSICIVQNISIKSII